MVATLVIFLREGVEASMIVAILLAYLKKSGQQQYFRDVFLGVGAAVALAGLFGVVVYRTVESYDGSRVQTIFETATYLVATALLTYMTFWMRNHARGLSSELRSRVDAATGRDATGVDTPAGGSVTMTRGARVGMSLLAFQAVGREGLETVVFTLAIAFSKNNHNALAGAVIGLVIALMIAFTIYRLGHRLNMGRFFAIVGALLMLFAAGLLADAVQNMQELGWLPFGRGVLWHTGGMLSEDSTWGDVAHSFLGYAEAPTVLQAVAYVGYLALALLSFFSVLSKLKNRAQAPEPRKVPTPVG